MTALLGPKGVRAQLEKQALLWSVLQAIGEEDAKQETDFLKRHLASLPLATKQGKTFYLSFCVNSYERLELALKCEQSIFFSKRLHFRDVKDFGDAYDVQKSPNEIIDFISKLRKSMKKHHYDLLV